jgi:hypothetical protein
VSDMEFQKYKDAKTAVTQSTVYSKEFNPWRTWRAVPLVDRETFNSFEPELTQLIFFPLNLVRNVCILFQIICGFIF